MGLTLITPATVPPVTLADARTVCRIEASETSFDPLLTLLLGAAVDELAAFTGQALGEQGWRLSLDQFTDTIELPRGPATAVASVGYYDIAGTLQTLSPAIYTIDLVTNPQWLVLNSGKSWPELLDAVNVVRVDFTAGYSPATLPPGLKGAVLGLIAHRWDNGAAATIPAGVLDAASPFRPILI